MGLQLLGQGRGRPQGGGIVIPKVAAVTSTLFMVLAMAFSTWVSLTTDTSRHVECVEETVEEVEMAEPMPVEEWTRLCGPNATPDLDTLIQEVATEYDVDPRILATISTKESTCNPKAVGGAGELGLTQVHPKVWTQELVKEGIIQEPADLLDPRTNLQSSAYIIKGLLKRNRGDVWKTFRRYNGSGPMARRYADHALSIYNSL